MRTPQWKSRTLHNAGDLRNFLAEASKKIKLWNDSDD
jgi:hypothetical protein